jgi:hypothetical protein
MTQPRTAINDKATRVTIRVDLFFGDVFLGPASGFFYRGANGRTYLVTNWHVVSGRNPTTQKTLHSKAAIPDRLKLYVPMNLGSETVMQVQWREYFLLLYANETRQQPIWLVHPDHKHEVDIAIMPLNGLNETILLVANDPQLDVDELRLYPGMDVYVIGYPRGMFGGAKFPIWKRGSIASEPEFNVDQKPVFYIDTVLDASAPRPRHGQVDIAPEIFSLSA